MALVTAPEFNRAQALVAKMLGVGEGDYGYNQPTKDNLIVNGVNSYPIADGGSLSSDHVVQLRKDVLMIAYHQIGTTIPSTKVIPEVLESTINTTVERILLATIGSRQSDGSLPAVPSGWLIPTRTAMYPLGTRAIRNPITGTVLMTETWNSTTTHTHTVTFTDADAMRCYFNSGCTIEITPTKSGTATTKNTKWSTLFSTIGTLSFQLKSTLVSRTKTSTSNPGYDKLTETDLVIFTKSSTTTSEVYTVSARIDGINSIIFSSTFANDGVNVTGSLTSTFKSFHAVRAVGDSPSVYMAVPAPSYTTAYEVGTPDPSFTITKTPNTSQLTETGKSVNMTFVVNTTNFVGDVIYYSIIKDMVSKPPSASDIIIEDFLESPLTLEGALDIVKTGDTGVSTQLVVKINADQNTEGLDKFNIEFRATENLSDPVLISVLKAFSRSISISDTSTTPKIIARTIRFTSLTTGSSPVYPVGSKVSFNIISTGITAPYETVTWKLRSVAGNPRDLTYSDFREGLEDTFKMPSTQKYTLSLNISNDAKFDKLEQFQVELYLTDPSTGQPTTRLDQISPIVQIAATVEIAQVNYSIGTPTHLTMDESGLVGISIPFTTPKLSPSLSKIWYIISAAGAEPGVISSTNSITNEDFTDKLLKGAWTVTQSLNSGFGTFKKIAASDKLVEGTEGFVVEFFKDSLYSQPFGKTPTLYITETVGYSVELSARSMMEPLQTGQTSTGKTVPSITFTLKTPFIPNTPATSVQWDVMPVIPVPKGGIGVFTDDDFQEGISGTTSVIDNAASITLTALDDGRTEGSEQFFVRFSLQVNGVTVTKDSPSASITETVNYTIERLEGSQSSLDEQPSGTTDGFEYTIRTPYLPPNTPIYWEVVSADKSILDKNDFTIGQYSGQIIINQNGEITNQATLSLVPVKDTQIEGTESFYVIVKTGTAKSTKVAQTFEASTITENIKPAIYPASQSLTEGATGTLFKISTPKVAVGTPMYWWISKGSKGTLENTDFLVSDALGTAQQRMKGKVVIDNTSSAKFTIAARQDAVANSSTGTEDEEKFVVSIGFADNDEAARTEELSITDISSYIITADVTSVVETDGSVLGSGSRTVTFKIYTPYFDNGHTLYYTVKSIAGTVDSSDFVIGSSQGTFQVNGNYKELTFKIKEDKSTAEGNEKFILEVRETGYTGTVPKGAISPGVLIYDTSITTGSSDVVTDATAVITSLDNKWEYYEGETINLRITTTGVLTTDALNWTTQSMISGGLSPYLSMIESSAPFYVSGESDPRTATTIQIQVTATTPVEGTRGFIFLVHKGSKSTDAIGYLALTIKDKPSYSIRPTTTLINESGNTGVQFVIVTPPDGYNQYLHWVVVPEPGFESDITGADFIVPNIYNFDVPSMNGTVAISPSGNGSFTIQAATDSAVERVEQFRIKLKKESSPGSGIWNLIPDIQSIPVSINDLTNYTLTPSATGMSNYTVSAGTPVVYTLTTPKLVASTMASPWSVLLIGTNISSVITPPQPFAVNDTVTTYNFTVTTSSLITDNKTFNVQIKDANGKVISPATKPNDITVIAPSIYQIEAKTTLGATASTISETDKIRVYVQSSTSPIYWYLAQTTSEEMGTNKIDSDDFSSPQKLAGTVNLTNKKADFYLEFANKKGRKDGTKKFHLLLSQTPPTTPIQSTLPDPIIPSAITGTITKTQTAVYSIEASKPSIPEGFPVTFKITTPYIATNVTYKWRVVPGSGSAITTVTADPISSNPLTGSFVISAATMSGTVTITVPSTVANDTRTFQLEISDNTSPAPVVVIPVTNSNNPTVTVTSVLPYVIVATASTTSTTAVTSVMEGKTLSFKITPPANVTAPAKLAWSVSADGIVNSTFTNQHVITSAGEVSLVSGVYKFVIDATIDAPTDAPTRNNNTNRKFKIVLTNPTTQATIADITQEIITITDYEYFSVSDNGSPALPTASPVINEGAPGNVIVFTVTAKTEDIGRNLSWKVNGTTTISGNPLTAANLGLTALSGNTGIVDSNKQVTFTITTVADAKTNPSEKSFSIDFKTTNPASLTSITSIVKTRLVRLKDTSTTVVPETYLVEDNGIVPPTAATADKDKPVIEEGGTKSGITFTVHTKTGETGPVYYEIRTTQNIIPGQLSTTQGGTPLVLKTGTITVTDRISQLSLYALADKTDNSKAKKSFYVVFGLSSPIPATVPAALTSRTVIIADTSKEDPPALTMTITRTVPEVVQGNRFVVECKLSPLNVSVPVTWKIVATNDVLTKIQRSADITSKTQTILPYTQNSTVGNWTGVSTANAQFCVVSLGVLPTNDVCGMFKVVFTANDPVTKTPLTVETSINLNHIPKKDIIRKPTTSDIVSWPIPAGVDRVSVKLYGGEGSGGVAQGGSRTGGNGSYGDIVTGIIDVRYILSKTLTFRFINGSNGGPAKTSGWQVKPGNPGGAAVAVYTGTSTTSNPLATAAGGGAGGNCWADGGNGGNALPPTSVSVFNPICVSTPGPATYRYNQPTTDARGKFHGCGGGGGGGGINYLAWWDDDNDSRGPRSGASSGVSFVPAGWKRIEGTVDVTPTDVPSEAYATVTYAPACGTQLALLNQSVNLVEAVSQLPITVPAGATKATITVVGAGGGGGGAQGQTVQFTNQLYTRYTNTTIAATTIAARYGIYDGVNKKTITATFRTVKIPAGKYILDFDIQYSGYIMIGTTKYTFNSPTIGNMEVNITSTYNRSITVYAALKGTYSLTNPYYVAAALRGGSQSDIYQPPLTGVTTPIVDPNPPTTIEPGPTYFTDSDYIWTTRDASSLIPSGGNGNSQGWAGAGGGAGGASIKTVTVNAGEELLVTVGAGGAGAKGAPLFVQTASTGGNSFVSRAGTTLVVGYGGSGGAASNSGTTNPPAGGAGGAGDTTADSWQAGLPGVKSTKNNYTSIATTVGSAGGTNEVSFGYGGKGGDVIETPDENIYTAGDKGTDGYVLIVWS